jgi:high-affinity nickel permease
MDIGTESAAIVGLAFGVRHAMQADHVMAVASLAVRSAHRAGDAVRLAACWGIGHGTMMWRLGPLR